ncbi:MAG TPA: hypothetical protein VKV69_13800 [Actinomycetota bacterium]|nr:hypothetical protein [Actinomycetota bacterium]
MSDEPIDQELTDEKRVQSRAHELEEENSAPVDDPHAQARAMLEYSDQLQEDPATKDLDDERVERRTSEDATPPPDA